MHLKTSNKSLWSNVLWYVKMSILWKCIQCTVHWHKTQILKKFFLEKISGTKMPSIFFRELQLITDLLLICDSYMSWSTRFVFIKLCVRFSIFHLAWFFLILYFSSTKFVDFLTLTSNNSFQNQNNRKATHSFVLDLWFLSCNKRF